MRPCSVFSSGSTGAASYNPGQLSGLFLAGWAAGQLFMQTFRATPAGFGGLKLAQVTALPTHRWGPLALLSRRTSCQSCSLMPRATASGTTVASSARLASRTPASDRKRLIQSAHALGAQAGNRIEGRGEALLGAGAAMKADGEAVGLVPHALDQE